MRRFQVAEIGGYAAVCLAMWGVPLLNRLHVESSAVLATASFFLAGLAALAELKRGGTYGRVLADRLLALGLPLVLMLVPMFWAPNCGWLLGVGFFLLFPGVTVVLSVGIASLASRFSRPRIVLIGTGVVLALMGPVYDLGFHPQFYTYNHVFGGVLGPIYDEQLAMRPGLFVFRGMTLIWAVVCLLVASRNWALAGTGLAALSLCYGLGGRLGINTSYSDLERRLSGILETEHFRIAYDPVGTDSTDLRLMADLHEFEFARLENLLQTSPTARIRSFVYPDVATRARLTGARYTSTAPVWLSVPQVHVVESDLEAVFPHELAHAFSREFGLPVIKASLSVGMVEGLAVAVEPPGPRPSMDDLVSAAVAATGIDAGASLADILSPWGFWTARGGVSYTVTGSFVRYLLAAYGAGPLKEAYASSDLSSAYGQSVARLAEGWRSTLEERPWIDRYAVQRARVRLGAPSLFEQECPHWIPRPLLLRDKALEHLARGDTTAADKAMDLALRQAPEGASIRFSWVSMKRLLNEDRVVGDSLLSWQQESLPWSLGMLRADEMVRRGDEAEGRAAYERLLHRLPGYARTEKMLTAIRLADPSSPLVRDLELAVEDLPLATPAGLTPWAAAAWPSFRLFTLAGHRYHQGRPDLAADLAAMAEHAYEELGDLTMARYVGHLAGRYRFAARRSTPVRNGPNEGTP